MSQLNGLANSIATQAATKQLQLANYFTPYGFDPELADFERIGQLMSDHGDLNKVVFAQASENLQSRVADATAALADFRSQLDALQAAGAEVSITDADLFEAAKATVFQRRPQAA